MVLFFYTLGLHAHIYTYSTNDAFILCLAYYIPIDAKFLILESLTYMLWTWLVMLHYISNNQLKVEFGSTEVFLFSFVFDYHYHENYLADAMLRTI